MNSSPEVPFYASVTVRHFIVRILCLPCVCVVRDVLSAISVVRYVLMDFHKTFVVSASWDKDKLIRFWSENEVKVPA